MSSERGPNPISVAWAIFRARRVSAPHPHGDTVADYGVLETVLEAVRSDGVHGLPDQIDVLRSFRDQLGPLNPEMMTRDEALAYWLNLYNAGALELAAKAAALAAPSVLRVPGAFTSTWVDVAGEALSLNDIEHGKIRRFKDPRIHGALVCGSASCPNLRYEPFYGPRLEDQLDDQIRGFLSSGAASAGKGAGELRLSRVFLWYGADFTRPQRMPTLLPTRRSSLVRALGRWLDPETRTWVEETKPKIVFRPYDWELGCAVA
jgi:hypothetical protein